MQAKANPHDMSSNLHVISCNVKTLNHVKQLHAQLLLRCLHPNTSLFTAILKLYSQYNSHANVFHVFAHLRRARITPEASIYPIVIKAAGAGGPAVQAHVVKLGFASDKFVRNAVLDMYCKNGLVEVAEKVFDEMPERTVADCNVMISGFWRWGDGYGAREVFEGMVERSVVTWTAMVSGYAKAGDLVMARSMFDEMPERSVVSWNAMLSGYAQNGLAEDCLGLFEEMMDCGVVPSETTWVTVISSCADCGCLELAERFVGLLHRRRVDLNGFVKTALIDMYAKCGSLVTAQKIFDEMKNKNVVSWNTMISGYVKNGDVVSARELFDKMSERNVISWNTMIAGYAQNGQSAQAIELFKEMVGRNVGVQPDEVTVVSVLSACGHLGALGLGRWTVDLITESNIKLTSSGHNALIYMYSRCGNMEEAKRTFSEMPSRDLVSYNSLIAGLAAHGRGFDAMKLMSQMKEEGIEPDRITFICILTACSHAGLAEEGRLIFNSIKAPTVDHYACLIDLLGRFGKLDEAKNLVGRMPMEPHAGVFGAILNACCIHKEVELGEFAASKLFELEPENSGNYVLLSNIYAAANRWEDVDRVRKMMGERGLRKASGWSWIEFNRIMHRFIAGDKSHERCLEIYSILDNMGKRVRNLGYVADKACVLRNVEEEEKEEMVGTHSEKLAIAFGFLVSGSGNVIRVVKNLRVCRDCHHFTKIISKLEGREIIVRDNSRFHHFKDGKCSCNDYW